MNPTKFPEQNLVLKGNGKDVEDLNAWVGVDESTQRDLIVTCYDVMPLEKILILFFGKVYFRIYTTKDHFPPVLPEVDNPFQPFTEPMGKVVGNLVDRKVKQFIDDMEQDDEADFDNPRAKELLSKVLNGFAIWLIQDMTHLKENYGDKSND